MQDQRHWRSDLGGRQEDNQEREDDEFEKDEEVELVEEDLSMALRMGRRGLAAKVEANK